MTKFERHRWSFLICIAVLSLILTAFCGYVYSKYIKNETMKGSLTITAELGDITVWEHKAEQNKDGSYQLDDGQKVQQNFYYLIPGLDIPKDPCVEITDHSSVPVYVFIKVDTNLTDAHQVSYQLQDCWQLVAGTANIYVYCVDGTPCPVTGDMEIQILKDDMVEVKQGLQVTGQVYLNFTAAMSQQDAGLDAAKVMALFPES